MKAFARFLRPTFLIVTFLLLLASIGSTESSHYKKDYHFTSDWFTKRIPIWKQILKPYENRPHLHYLEIGLYEGRSAIWMLENILTHPTSRLTGIDIFSGEVKKRYFENIKLSGYQRKVSTYNEASQIRLRSLTAESFDLIYIDGGHRARDVLADAVLSWDLLKRGGILILDDYGWKPEFPMELRPRPAIDIFITAYREDVEIVHKEYQVFLKKKEKPCGYEMCTAVGPYIYVWLYNEPGFLIKQENQERVPMSPAERRLFEEFLRARKNGETNFFVSKKLRNNEAFLRLVERLKLDLSAFQQEQ